MSRDIYDGSGYNIGKWIWLRAKQAAYRYRQPGLCEDLYQAGVISFLEYTGHSNFLKATIGTAMRAELRRLLAPASYSATDLKIPAEDFKKIQTGREEYNEVCGTGHQTLDYKPGQSIDYKELFEKLQGFSLEQDLFSHIFLKNQILYTWTQGNGLTDYQGRAVKNSMYRLLRKIANNIPLIATETD